MSSRTVRRNLGLAVLDAAGYASTFAVGFNPMTAAGLLWRLGNATATMLRRRGAEWLHWEMQDWPLVYANNLPQTAALRIPAMGDHPVRVPYVIEIDNTQDSMPLDAFTIRGAGQFVPAASLTEPHRGIVDYYTGLKRGLSRSKVILHDGTCARAAGYDPESRTLTLQSVSYFAALQTNMAMDHRDETGVTLRARVHGEGLEPLGTSSLADPLGINVLLLCEGDYQVVLERSLTTAVRPGELCPSASGTVIPKDVRGQTLADVALLREVQEELGEKVAEACEDLTFLGMARDVIRGGLPDLFFVAQCRLTRDEIAACQKTAKDRGESRAVHFFQIILDGDRASASGHSTPFDVALGHALERMARVGRISPMLWTQLALWSKWRLNGHS